ncbi:MAG TPA: hypothetical protein VNA11_18440 [Pseudonocardia sp.]|nr:hypothetical protein [Pseudonocardia sp.]
MIGDAEDGRRADGYGRPGEPGGVATASGQPGRGQQGLPVRRVARQALGFTQRGEQLDPPPVVVRRQQVDGLPVVGSPRSACSKPAPAPTSPPAPPAKWVTENVAEWAPNPPTIIQGDVAFHANR